MHFLQLFTVALGVTAVWSGVLGQENLRQRARANNGVAEDRLFSEYGVASIDDLLLASSTVVHGRILESHSHLNVTETQVVTDFTLTPIRFFKQDPSLVTSSTPGRVAPLVIRRRGGTVVEGPLRMRTIVDAYADGEPETGAEVVAFLGYDKIQKVYYFANGPFGLFRVREGRAESLTKEVAQRRGDIQPPVLSVFLNDIAAKLAKSK